MIPKDLEALLTREETASALTETGHPTAATTLATMVTRGGGPPYCLYGQRAIYRWGDALSWAKARMTPPRRSTSESDAAKAA